MLADLYLVYSVFGWLSYVWLFFLGLILGSFLNSWMWRARENIKIITSNRSVCFHCHRQLRWFENIPVISFVALNRRCSSCKHLIPWRYPAVELMTAVLMTIIAYYHVRVLPSFDIWIWLRDIFFVTILIVIFTYDYLYQEIMTDLVWAGAVLGFILNYYFTSLSVTVMLVGAVIGGGFFGVQYLLSKGRWIGGGDVRLGVMMGVWLGAPGVMLALLISYVSGAVAAIYLLVSGRAGRQSAIPFGTFLSFSTILVLYFSPVIFHWFFSALR